jgi:hypothetical protein
MIKARGLQDRNPTLEDTQEAREQEAELTAPSELSATFLLANARMMKAGVFERTPQVSLLQSR